MSQVVLIGAENPKLASNSQEAAIGEEAPDARPICRRAGTSFAVGLVALRVCWLPGVNTVLGAVAIVLGADAFWQILRSRKALSGIDEAVSGIVLGVVVLGLSVFFLSLLIAAYRG